MPLTCFGDAGAALGIVDSLAPVFRTPSACPSRGQACGSAGTATRPRIQIHPRAGGGTVAHKSTLVGPRAAPHS